MSVRTARKAGKFPLAGSMPVDRSKLSQTERMLVLYRDVKRAIRSDRLLNYYERAA
jgi:hypothetical protein